MEDINDNIDVLVFVRTNPSFKNWNNEVIWQGNDSNISIMSKSNYQWMRALLINKYGQWDFTEIQLILPKRHINKITQDEVERNLLDNTDYSEAYY